MQFVENVTKHKMALLSRWFNLKLISLDQSTLETTDKRAFQKTVVGRVSS